jgi:hypothetical protein
MSCWNAKRGKRCCTGAAHPECGDERWWTSEDLNLDLPFSRALSQLSYRPEGLLVHCTAEHMAKEGITPAVLQCS